LSAHQKELNAMLNGKTVLVTHVTHFVGMAAAQALVQQSALVVCHDLTFADASVRAAFITAHPTLVASPHVVAEEVVAEVEATHGALDVLVSNDFFPAQRAPIDEAQPEDLRAAIESLTVQPFVFASAAAKRMKPRRAGKIIFVTSAAPLNGLPNYAMYATARGAANTLAISLAQELAAFNIQVNAVAPNYIASPSYFPPSLIANPDALKRMTDKVPLRRLGTPDEVGQAIAYLASPGADFVTGLIMPVSGGWA
jgi:NAD(P)-dependent dehydrogenase (short-subunit alcohol dehydrogenase family)